MSTDTTIFGPIVAAADVEDWVFAVLARWSCTYLSEISRQHGITAGALPDVRAWVPAPTFDKWPEDQLPAVFVVSTGTSERPAREGDGRYRARFAIRVGVVCTARRQAEARKLAMLYLAAHRTLLIQRPSLEGHAAGVVWQGDAYTQLNYDDTRTLYSGESSFTVEVDGVCYGDAGPTTPDDPRDPCTDPWPPWSTVKLVDIDVEAIPLLTSPTPVTREEE
jgi:hypothetical protein